MKADAREKAVALRKNGLTYNEILKKIPVAKSTLSLWLREVGLAKPQLQRISEKKRAAQQHGADAKRRIRVERTEVIYDTAREEIGNLSKRELRLVGATLYWAEGSKAKPHSVSTGIDFGNTDPEMIRLFLFWLRTVLQISPDRIHSSLYLHINHKHRLPDVVRHWEEITKMSVRYVYYKKHNPKKTYRKNIADTYFGTLRIRVSESTDLQRKIQGWIYGITGEHCPVV